MALIKDGYWQDTYWPSRYWQEDYWLEYGTAVAAPPAAPIRRGYYTRRMHPLRRMLPLPEDLLDLFMAYLEMKIGENE